MKNIFKFVLFFAFVVLASANAIAQQAQVQYVQPQQQYPQQGQVQYVQPQQGQVQYQGQQYPATGAGQVVPGYQQQRQYVVPHYYTQQQQLQNADGVFGMAKNKAVVVFRNIRSIVFILGGFALVGLAVMAIFGKPNWKWFALLAVGIFTVAVAGAIVEFLAGQSNDLGNTIQPTHVQRPVYQQPVPAQPVYR